MNKSHNNRMHSDSKKRRSSFLVALLFAAGDAWRYPLNNIKGEKMNRILTLLIFTLFWSSSAFCSQYKNEYSSSLALVVGINKYSLWPQLEYAVKDANEVSYLLKQQGFHVDVLLNEKATKRNIWEHLRKIGNRVDENSRVVFYFAGHGQTEDMPTGGEQGYLVPVNADLYNWASTMLSMKEVNSIVKKYKAKHIFLAFDSCYSGLGLSRGIKVSKVNQDPGYIAKMRKLKSIQVLTAGGRSEQAIEADGHGLFTNHLLAALSGAADINSDGFTTGTEIYATVRPSVTKKSFNRQTPQFGYLIGEGDIIFTNESNKRTPNATLTVNTFIEGVDVWVDTEEVASNISTHKKTTITVKSGRHRLLAKKGGRTLYSETVYLSPSRPFEINISGTQKVSKRTPYSMFNIVSKDISNYSQSIPYDLDGDGIEEIITAFENNLQVFDRKGKLYNSKQFNYRIRLDLVKQWSGKTVIAVSGKDSNVVVLTLLDPNLHVVWQNKRRITKKYQGKWDGGGRIVEIADIDNDGKDEVLSFSSAGYAWKPRGVIAYDENSNELWRYLTGPGPTSIALWKNNRGISDIVIGTYSPGNGNRERHNNTDDKHCYVISISSRGQTNWVIEVGSYFTGSKVLLSDLDNDGEKELYVAKSTAYNYRTDEGAIYKISRNGRILNQFSLKHSIKSVVPMEFSSSARALFASDKTGYLYKLDDSLRVIEKRNLNRRSEPLIINLVGAHDYDGDKEPELLLYSFNRLQKGKNPRSDSGPRNKVFYYDMKYQVLSNDLKNVEKNTFIAEEWSKWRGFRIINFERPEMAYYPFLVTSDKITVFNF